MFSNLVWGMGLVMVGTSMILNKLYGIAIPFEIMLGVFLILLGLSIMFKMQQKRSQ